MKIDVPFGGATYQARSLDASAQRCVNAYLEGGPSGVPPTLYGTPGSTLWLSIGASPIRGMLAAGGWLWVVAGSFVFRITTAGVATVAGIIPTSSGRVSMAANISEVIIVDGDGGYLVDFVTATLDAITDPDFPAGVTQVVYIDGYFIVAGDGSGRFYINESSDVGSAWNGTDFATAEGSTDAALTLVASQRELHILGEDSSEVWVNTGNPTFPFERAGVAFIEHGIVARWSAAKLENTIFWLGQDKAGQGAVYMAVGYVPERISTHAIEHAITQYSSISDAFALSYTDEGHSFYVITFPSGNATFVYDVATGAWHERGKYSESTGDLAAWNASHHVFFAGKHLVSDLTRDRIYELSNSVYTDDGGAIQRLIRTAAINAKQERMFYSELRVRMETGSDTTVDPQVFLRWSDDGGHAWSNYHAATAGNIGRYGDSPVWRRLGMARNRVFELSMTDPVRFSLIGATVEVTA